MAELTLAERYKQAKILELKSSSERRYLSEVEEIRANRGILPITLQIKKASQEKEQRDARRIEYVENVPAEQLLQNEIDRRMQNIADSIQENKEALVTCVDPEEKSVLLENIEKLENYQKMPVSELQEYIVKLAEDYTIYNQAEISQYNLATAIGIYTNDLDHFIADLDNSEILATLSPEQIQEIAGQVKEQYPSEISNLRISNAIFDNNENILKTAMVVGTGTALVALASNFFGANAENAMIAGGIGVGITAVGYGLARILDKIADKLFDKTRKMSTDGKISIEETLQMEDNGREI